MKKLYKQYIKISKDEKISDSIFKSRIILSVISILSCLTMMVSTAFACFNTNLTKKITMSAATWDIYVEEIGQGRTSSVYACPETKIYEFTLSRSDTATATEGYCIIRITSPEEETKNYCTSSFNEKMTIRIQAVAGCVIEFEPQWGKPSDYYITDTCDETIVYPFTLLEESFSENNETSTSLESTVKESSLSVDYDESALDEADTALDKAEASDNKVESYDSGESLKENTESLLAENSCVPPDASSSSLESNTDDSLSKETETESTISQDIDSSSSSDDSSLLSESEAVSDTGFVASNSLPSGEGATYSTSSLGDSDGSE